MVRRAPFSIVKLLSPDVDNRDKEVGKSKLKDISGSTGNLQIFFVMICIVTTYVKFHYIAKPRIAVYGIVYLGI